MLVEGVLRSVELFFGSKILQYEVRATPVAQKWFALLKKKAKNPPLFRSPPRHRGFESIALAIPRGLKHLKNSCLRIHEYDSGILPVDWALWLRSIPNQNQLNHLHHAFERMRGEASQPRPYFNKAPIFIQEAIVELNEAIHQLEWLAAQNDESKVIQIKTEFRDVEKWPLMSEDYEEFSFERPFGSLQLHYCQVGKPWFDVFINQDEIVPRDGIRPLSSISGEFDLRFGGASRYPGEAKMRSWLQHSKGLDPSDPMLALGWVTVADLIDPPLSKKERAVFIEGLIAAGPLQKLSIPT